jgi:hypothetical protein
MHFRVVLIGMRARAETNTTGDGMCLYHSHYQVMERFEHFKTTTELLPVTNLKKMELPKNAYDCWQILNNELLNTIPSIASEFIKRDLSVYLNRIRELLTKLRDKNRPGFIPASSNVWGTPHVCGHLFMKNRPLILFVYQQWENEVKWNGIVQGKSFLLVIF